MPPRGIEPRTSCLQGKRSTTELRRQKMHSPGIEPGAHAWKASMLPLHQECLCLEGRNRTADYLRTETTTIKRSAPELLRVFAYTMK